MPASGGYPCNPGRCELSSVLKTGRLILRAHRLDDFEPYVAMWADPDVTRHVADGAPRSEEASWASFLSMAGHWQLLGFGNWAIEEKGSRRYVGVVGFSERMRDRGVELAGLPEMGWTLIAASAGRGYATEAVSAALTWARAHFGPSRIIAIIAPENHASMRVAEKCGFSEFHSGLSAGRPRVFFDKVL